MRTICAWCQTVMAIKEPVDDRRDTNSICAACEAQFRELWQQAQAALATLKGAL